MKNSIFDIVWKPIKFYLETTIYSKLSPRYSKAASIMELRKQNAVLKKQLQEEISTNQEILRQREITETYYNTLQDLKRKTYE